MCPSQNRNQTDIEDSSTLAPKIEQLTESVRGLTNQVEVLRNVLDELRSEVVWGIRNGRFGFDPASEWHVRLRSMPADPCADWSGRVHTDSTKVTKSSLDSDEPFYCCAYPQLQSLGGSGRPSIECANCGYVVAVNGQLSPTLGTALDLDEDGGNSQASTDTQDDARQSFLWPGDDR
jgi:hypothetical protein